MTPEFANVIDPVFMHVLKLLERIEQGQTPEPDFERQKLHSLLSELEAKMGSEEGALARRALVYWIDEVLIDASWPNASWWADHILEFELLGTNEGATLFFSDAERSRSSPHLRNALEVYYLCVVLGFRGIYRNQDAIATIAEHLDLPGSLDDWVRRTATSIGVRQRVRPDPPLEERGTAPPLSGVSKMFTASSVAAVLAAVLFVFAMLRMAWAT
ncbi:MAG TPA: DotU family type IV/VI secretion system protein [Pirellulales bacterium]|nr:DotU family type IV/VI secretion system protein [Pirellulales bacterium]